MTSLTRFSLLLLLVSFACHPKTETTHNLPTQLDSLFATVPDFSGVVLVAENGKPLYHKAFGYRNFETKTPLDTADIFELASVSKQFTAALIMMLQQDGRLNFDDPLENYINMLPYKGITIRHLLTHTSGLPDYQKVMDEHWDKTKQAGNADILHYLKHYRPPILFEPGKKYAYSNTGYVLLGSIVALATEEDFVKICRQRIFQPVDMNKTDIRSMAEKNALAEFAIGHIYVSEKQRYIRADSFPASNYVFWLGNRKGPGRVSSTTTDLLKWDRNLYHGTILKKETLEQAFAPATLKNDSLSNYGFGWKLRSHPVLGKVVFHDGDNPGYKTVILRYIEADKTVIVLCNNAHEKFDDIIKSIDQFLPGNHL